MEYNDLHSYTIKNVQGNSWAYLSGNNWNGWPISAFHHQFHPKYAYLKSNHISQTLLIARGLEAGGLVLKHQIICSHNVNHVGPLFTNMV